MKATLIMGGITIAIVGGMMWLASSGGPSGSPSGGAMPANVRVADGIQIVEIQVRGGYQPQNSNAKAGVPTKVRFDTNGTFDCSSSVRFPALGISKLLPSTGVTDIDIGTSTPGVLYGSCGMGMYRFQIAFQ